MSDSFWKKIQYVCSLLPLGVLFGLVAFTAKIEIKDLDLWFHLGLGRFITLTQSIPNQDFLSFTIGGQPWSNHEWLFQVFVYNIYNMWGPNGLLQMQVILVVTTMLLLLFLGYNRDRLLPVTFSLFMVYLVYQQRFTLRPDLMSLTFFTIYIFVLSLHIDKKWVIPFLVFIQILWTNIHGFFFFGPLFVLIGLVSEGIKRRIPLPYEWNESGRLTDGEFRNLKILFIFVLGSCLVNPDFINGALYPLKVFFSIAGEDKIFFKYIQELQKPVTLNSIFAGGPFVYYKLFILLSFISFIFNRRNIDISALIFWLVFLVFSLKAARNMPFFAFASYMVIITNLVHVNYKDIIPLRFTEKKFQYLTMAIFNLLFMMWILRYSEGIIHRDYYDLENYTQKSEFGGVSIDSYPIQAVDFLVENNIKGQFFNDFNSGAYLIGRASPNIKVFIDGRTEAYGGEYFERYQDMWEHGKSNLLDEAIDRYQISGAFLNSINQRIPEASLRYFYKRQDFIPVYFNYDAVIFLKDTPFNRPWIDRFAVDLKNWKAEQKDVLRYGFSQIKPRHNFYRAFTLESLDLDEAAESEAREALRINPFYSDPIQVLGKVNGKRKEYQKAFEYFRQAVMLSPHNDKMRYNLAQALYDLGEYPTAIGQYQVLKSKKPNSPKPLVLMSRAQYRLGIEFEDVLENLLLAVRLDPKAANDVLIVGDMYFQDKDYKRAQKIYELVLNIDEFSIGALYNLQKVFKIEGDLDKAMEYMNRALEVDPDNEDFLKESEQLKDSFTNSIK